MSGIPNVLKPQPKPAARDEAPMSIREFLRIHGLAPVLDMIGDEFPQYANELHEIANKVESDAAALTGRRR